MHSRTSRNSCCCARAQARQGDYLSRIADVTRIPLDKLLEDNIDAIKDLRASLAGTRLLLCKPAQGVGGTALLSRV